GPVIVEGPSGPVDGARTPGSDPNAGPAGGPAAGPAGGPAAAGFFEKLDPRNIIRLASVLQMKDRSGVVGYRGVGPLLDRILAAKPADQAPPRVHVVGHSYGCKVALSALTALSAQPARSVRSTLLLQPALSYLALADDVPDLHRPGGYAVAKSRCDLPILATWSRHDAPLRTFFALAVRRRSDLGEQNVGAAGRDEPPSKYAAMGGYGPAEESDVADTDILDPAAGTRYPLDPGSEVLAINGTARISGHGDVTNPATSWALYNLISQ
ncbi:alpha/beta fold hydrolase, partial [Kribbia dieselivorans]|uniref:alpha/beta fold hydrolase n=1 Tax=Kribbia dieselivorans TaxID=331526 RepID=UPI000A4F64B7